MTFSFDVGAESEDARYAEMLAAHFRTDQRVESLDDYDIASIVPSAVWHTEEPISLGEIPTWCLAILASKHVRVLLSGDGTDELFSATSNSSLSSCFHSCRRPCSRGAMCGASMDLRGWSEAVSQTVCRRSSSARMAIDILTPLAKRM